MNSNSTAAEQDLGEGHPIGTTYPATTTGANTSYGASNARVNANPSTTVNMPAGRYDAEPKVNPSVAPVGRDMIMVCLWISIFCTSTIVWSILAAADYFFEPWRAFVMFTAISTTLSSFFAIPYWMSANMQNFWRRSQNTTVMARVCALLPTLLWLGLWAAASTVMSMNVCQPPNTNSQICNWNAAIDAMCILTTLLWLAYTMHLIVKAVRAAY